MTTTATIIQDVLSTPLDAFESIEGMAEELLSRCVADPAAQPTIEYGDLTSRQAQRLIRPLLACLALKSEAETGTPVNAYGGTLAFVRIGKSGPVQITGEFENSPGKVRLAFQRPAPVAIAVTVPSGRRGPATAPALVDLLDPAVLAYRIEDTGFTLASDLARLDRVRSAGAVEAVVLYCTRILESMARVAVAKETGPERLKLARLLEKLVDYRHMPWSLKKWLDRLRDLGNDARHVNRELSEADADVAFAILLKWFDWTFREARHGPRLKTITVPNQPADALVPRQLKRLLDDDEAARAEVVAALTGPAAHTSAALLTPIVPAAVAEALLARDSATDPADARNRASDAQVILELARRRFPADLRLRQLLGLYWSRRGSDEGNVEHLHRARKELESLRQAARGPTADETFGILGGVYKRMADLDPVNATDWQRQSLRTYNEGWEQSGRENNYLGINAAAMTVLLGQPAERAEVLAGPIRDRLSNLQSRLRANGGPDRPLTYWDQVTWAEAELLLGNWAQAGELYRDAFARFSTRTKDIGVSVDQAHQILKRLGLTDYAGVVLGAWGSRSL